jgi:sodium transport system ATP-binding protein
VIEVTRLGKRFSLPSRRNHRATERDPREEDGWFNAVREVSFNCEGGSVMGLLGPNGAGKTTTLRMLSTAIAPTAGSVLIDGIDLIADPLAARRRIGFLSGATGLYGRLTVRENIRYFGDAHGVARTLLNSRTAELLSRLGMQNYADRRVDTLSTGMKQRAVIARTLIHAPRVIILDEPTTGLDILGAQVVLDFMREQSEGGATVVFSTHHLHEIEALCQEVCVIDRGRSVFEGRVESLREAGADAGAAPASSLSVGYLAQLQRN